MKYLIFTLLYVINFALITPSSCYAAQTETHFAQVLQSGVYLYKNTNGEKLFELPSTYFVKVTAESDEYYSCFYDNISGWVKKSEVAFIEGVPTTPYLTNSTFRVLASEACSIRKLPTSQSSIIGKSPLYKYVKYIGSIEGEEMVEGLGTTWYYTTTTTSKEIIYGYIYAGLCDGYEGYPKNDEKHIYVDPIALTTTISSPSGGKSFILLIVGVSIPALLLVYMMYKPYKVARKARKKHSVYHTISKLYDDNEI